MWQKGACIGILYICVNKVSEAYKGPKHEKYS